MRTSRDISPEFLQHLTAFHFIDEIPVTKRTKEQADTFNEAIDFIRDNIEEYYDRLTEKELKDIDFGFDQLNAFDDDVEFFEQLEEALERSVIPPLKSVNAENISRVMLRINGSIVEVYGVLEQIKPLVYKWRTYKKRIFDITKSLLVSDKEWKANGLSEIMFPTEYSQRITKMEYYYDRFKLRLEALQASFEVISRIITLHIGVPAGEFVKTDTNYDTLSDTFENVRPKDTTHKSAIEESRPQTGRSFGQRKKK